MSEPRKNNGRILVFDCDPGCDDAMAISLLVQHQWHKPKDRYASVDILTVAGNVSVEQTTANAARVLAACCCGKQKNNHKLEREVQYFSIYRGSAKATDGREPSASSVHGRDGLGDAPNSLIWRNDETKRDAAVKNIEALAFPKKPKMTAVERLLQLAAGTQAFHLLCTGPLTNLASALSLMNGEQQRTFWTLCERVVIMGGSFDAKGNITHSAEFNSFADPVAVQVVLEAFGVFLAACKPSQKTKRLHFVSLDVTESVAIPLDEGDASKGNSPAAPFLQYALKQYGYFHVYHCRRPSALVKAGIIPRFRPINHARSQIAGKSGDKELKRFCYLHDPLAAWVLLHGWCDKNVWSASSVRIDTSLGEGRGRVILCESRAMKDSRPIVIRDYGTEVKWLSPIKFRDADRKRFINEMADLLGIAKSWKAKKQPSEGVSVMGT